MGASTQPSTGGSARDHQVPAEFTAFVTDHEEPLRLACARLTGNDIVAGLLAYDLLAAVALRWRWFAVRPGAAPVAATAYVNRLLRREARNWERAQGAPVAVRSAARGGATAVAVAEQVWHRAAGLRRGRRLIALATLAIVGLMWTVGPRFLPDVIGPDPVTLPTTVPEGVTIMPLFAELDGLTQLETSLPAEIHLDLVNTPLLRDQPVPRAVAVLRPDLGPLVVLATDGSTRIVNDTQLLGAQTVTTSLSPDGTKAVLPGSEGLLVLDVATAQLRSVPVPSARLGMRALAWRSPTTVILPGVDSALEVNVDTGAVTPRPGLTGYDVLNPVGDDAGELTEMLSATPDAAAPRIRMWGGVPYGLARANENRGRQVSAPPTPTGSPEYIDRAVGGPYWINDWSGTGYQSGILTARACSSRSIPLPSIVGRARSVVASTTMSGAYVGTLVAVDTTILEVVGFWDPRRILVAAHSSQEATVILAWYPHTAQLRKVTTIDMQARTSLVDLLQRT